MDVIAAIATGGAPTAIGIVRVSGPGCFSLCGRVFRAANGRPLEEQEPRRMVLGDVLDEQGRRLDQGLAVCFPGPGSFTGEDCAEFHCHGSPVVLRELLCALFAAGARQARAGEFTRRAFLNGRLDLTEAEAVIDLIDAQTAAAARNAAAQLEGGLRRVLEPIQESLLEITSRFYAVVDYPDEDIEDIHPEEISAALQSAGAALDRLLDGAPRRALLELEHRRWMRFMWLSGWQFGEKKDDVRRTHPCLVPFEALPPKEQEKDGIAYEMMSVFENTMEEAKKRKG